MKKQCDPDCGLCDHTSTVQNEVWVTYRKGTLYNVWESLEQARRYEHEPTDVHYRYVRA